MEHNPTTATERRESLQKKKKRIRLLLGIVLLLIAAVGICLLIQALTPSKAADVSVMQYRTVQVSEGEIHATVSGSGTLVAAESRTVSAPADVRVEAVYRVPGDTVKKGDAILTLSSDAMEEELAALYDELVTAQTRLAGTTKTRSNSNITAPRKGIVKALNASVGDAAEDLSYLCKISTDGLMQLTVHAADLSRYAEVSVKIGSETVAGTVASISNGKAIITVEDNDYAVGTAAEAYSSTGTSLGSGKLDVHGHVLVIADAGCIEEVRVSENDSVSKNAVLFVLRGDAPSATYLSRLAAVESIEQEIEEIESSLHITAEWDGLLAALYVRAGDEIESGTSLCLLTATEGYTLDLGIDELDISSVAIGQPVTLTLDAIEGEYNGKVTNLSYDGSGSYVTTYTATVTTDAIEGVYPGMSASAEIVTETSGSSLIVPVSAVQYAGDTAFLYLAADGEFSKENMDVSSLERITVTTGMSDGSYIAVSAEGLKAGDRIVVPTLTTTAVFEEDESVTTQFGGMGGMPGMSGGQMSNFGGSGGGIPNFGGGSGGGMPNFGGGNMRNNRGSTNNNRTN